jgi:hypothetical protein
MKRAHTVLISLYHHSMFVESSCVTPHNRVVRTTVSRLLQLKSKSLERLADYRLMLTYHIQYVITVYIHRVLIDCSWHWSRNMYFRGFIPFFERSNCNTRRFSMISLTLLWLRTHQASGCCQTKEVRINDYHCRYAAGTTTGFEFVTAMSLAAVCVLF